VCIWHLTAYPPWRRYRRVVAVMADPAITGLVSPYPTHETPWRPLGADERWRSPDPPWHI
jgi:hypothetical protein